MTESPTVVTARQRLERQLDRVGRDSPKGQALLAQHAAEARAARNGRIPARKDRHVSTSILERAAVSTGKPNGKAAPTPDEPPLGLLIDPAAIDIGENVRTDVDDLADLVESVRQHGVLEPIGVHAAAGGRYALIFGQRRLLAARKVGLAFIPATLVATSIDVPVVQLVENLQRRDLNPLEEARAIKRILDTEEGLTQAELAKRIGRSEPWVSNSLRLLELEDDVQKLLAEGKLQGAHAKALASLPAKQQVSVANEAVKGAYSARDVEERVRRVREEEAWRKQRDAAQRRETEERRAALKRRIEETAAKVAKDTPIFVGGGYYGSDQAGHVSKLFEEAGFTNVKVSRETLQSRPKGDLCDCTAWKVEIGWNGGLTIAPACIKPAHTEKAYKAKVDVERQAREFQDKVREAVQGRITTTILNLSHEDPIAARILLWVVMDWSLNDWVRDHKGDRKKPNAWDEISSLPHGELAVELAQFVRKGFTDRYNVKLDWRRIAAELGLEEAPSTEASA